MIVDPVFPVPHNAGMGENVFFNQINEEEEDNQLEEEPPAPVVEQAVQPAIEVNLPMINEPQNFLHLEIQEDGIMAEDEIQQQLHEEAAQGVAFAPQNLQMGFVFTSFQPKLPSFGPSVFPSFQPNLPTASPEQSVPLPCFSDCSGMWKKFFAPLHGVTQFSVPNEWASFFTKLLMSPTHFEKAKGFIQRPNLLSTLAEGSSVSFTLPKKCPNSSSITCKLSPLFEEGEHEGVLPVPEDAECAEVDLEEAPPVDSDGSTVPDPMPCSTRMPVVKKGKKKAPVLVESEGRRSPRLLKNKKGFKSPTCKVKGCLGCSATPPSISKKAIRKLSSALCDIDASQVSDEVLSKKKDGKAPVGPVSRKKKNKNDIDESNKEEDK